MIYGEDEFNRVEKDYQLTTTKMNRHNFVTLAAWLGIFVVGGLKALQGEGWGDFATAVSIIGMLEHLFAGNTGI